MASTPAIEPVAIPFVGTLTHRAQDYDKDYRYRNFIVEIENNPMSGETRAYLIKRDGMTENSNPSGGAAVGRGMYYWSRTGHLYTVFGDTLYLDGTSIQTLNTSTGFVSFAETQGGTPYLVLQDGADGWLVNTSDTVSQIVDADYPAATTQGLEVIDGYVFVVNSASGEVYNSDLNDPTSWTASNFFLPEMYADNAVGISRYRNLLVVFGEQSTEFFYDAANTSGSPLSRIEQMAQEIGCSSATTIARTDDVIYFVGTSKAGRGVYKIEADKFEQISSNALDRMLNQEGTDITNADAMMIELQGHTLYCLSLNTADRTMCYDTATNLWFEIGSGASGKLDSIYSTRTNIGKTIVQHRTDGKTYILDPRVYQDGSDTITCTAQTGLWDGRSNMRKFQARLDVVGDHYSSTNPFTLQWTDDDYQNFNTAISLDMANHSFIRAGGSFRRRGYKITHASNNPLRLEYLELEYTIGSA